MNIPRFPDFPVGHVIGARCPDVYDCLRSRHAVFHQFVVEHAVTNVIRKHVERFFLHL